MLIEPGDFDLLLRRYPFSRRLGLRVLEVGDGACTVRVPSRRTFERPGGIVSGDVYMTAADIAFWLAIKTFAGIDDQSVTSHMNTTFLSSAKREPFLCQAKVLRRGRRVTYGVAECATGERILTHHTLTYIRPSVQFLSHSAANYSLSDRYPTRAPQRMWDGPFSLGPYLRK